MRRRDLNGRVRGAVLRAGSRRRRAHAKARRRKDAKARAERPSVWGGVEGWVKAKKGSRKGAKAQRYKGVSGSAECVGRG